MRVLITGGAGFIGSHLGEALLARGDEVFVLDDLSTGSIDNIQPFRKHPRFHYTIDSVRNEAVVAELVEQVDVIFHLAAAVGVKLIVESPVRTIETNVHGTEVVLAQAEKRKRKVLIASTSEVYGLSNQVPFREDGNLVLGATTKGRWSYACSKAIDEFLALAYWREKRLPTIVVRLFNTVGPRQTGRYGMVIPTFVRQALAGQPITVYGDGTQSRCFTHVADVVGALIALMDHPGAVGEVYNIGSTEEVTIAALAEQVRTPGRHALRDRVRALRGGLRGRLRGHAPRACPTSPRSRRRSATGRRGRSPRSSRASSPRAAVEVGARRSAGTPVLPHPAKHRVHLRGVLLAVHEPRATQPLPQPRAKLGQPAQVAGQIRRRSSTYCSGVRAISSGRPRFDRMLTPARPTAVRPASVMTGTPIQSESSVVMPPL